MPKNNTITPVQQRVLDAQFEQLLFEMKRIYAKACSMNTQVNAQQFLDSQLTDDSTLAKIQGKLLGTGLDEELIAELFERYVEAHDPEFRKLLQEAEI